MVMETCPARNVGRGRDGCGREEGGYRGRRSGLLLWTLLAGGVEEIEDVG